MKFDPIRGVLLTDDGNLIKHLHCPFDMRWETLLPISNDSPHKQCDQCNNPVIETASYTDFQLLNLVEQNPETCLKVDLDQDNLTVTNHGFLE